jgi:hypothetical protein
MTTQNDLDGDGLLDLLNRRATATWPKELMLLIKMTAKMMTGKWINDFAKSPIICLHTDQTTWKNLFSAIHLWK